MSKPSYIRLIGRIGSDDNTSKDHEIYIKEIPAILGRGDNSIHIDDNDTTISRQHIMIDWDDTKSSYYIKCLSKNGIIVDKIKLGKDQEALVDNGSAIRIGTSKLYFTLPDPDKKRKDANSPSDNAEKKKRGSSAGLNEISILPDPDPDPNENSERVTYNAMVQACFEAVPLSYDMNQGIMMQWVINWVEARYPNTTQGVLKSSVNKGISGALTKLAERTDMDEHVIVKCTRWKLKKSADDNEPI